MAAMRAAFEANPSVATDGFVIQAPGRYTVRIDFAQEPTKQSIDRIITQLQFLRDDYPDALASAPPVQVQEAESEE
jgi:hypothetical protein